MEIVKRKRRCKCKSCFEWIDGKYVVRIADEYYHLTCIYKWKKELLEKTKKELKMFNKQKYKKQIIMEGLKNET